MDAPFTGSVFLGMSVDGFIARLDGDLSFLTGDSDRRRRPRRRRGRRLRLRRVRRRHRRAGDGPQHLRVHQALRRVAVPGQAGARAQHDAPPGADPRITVHRSLRRRGRGARAAGYRRVYVDGGRTVHTFLRAGLIADLTLSRVPVLIGTGHTPFGELAADIRLEHVRTQTFRGGMVQTTYRVRRPAESGSVGERHVDRDLRAELRALQQLEVVAGPEAARVVGVERPVAGQQPIAV